LNNLLLLLDEFGLSRRSPEDLLYVIGTTGKRKLRKYSQALVDATTNFESEDKPDCMDVFNFLAGSAIRGDSCCLQPECQAAKLHSFSRFAALYADRVVLPVEFVFSVFDDIDRFRFAHTINAINYLRPLIEAGIVTPQLEPTCICSDCLQKRGVSLDRITSEVNGFWRERAGEFRMVYTNESGKPPSLLITGPEAFLPHGGIRMMFRDPLENIRSRTKAAPGQAGVVVPKSTIVREGLLATVFHEFKSDLMAQQIYGLKYGATYLTDSPGQAAFFGELKARGESMANAARLCAHLAHSVPLFSDVSVEKALEIRLREPDAFVRYRSALNKIVRDHVRSGTFLGEEDATQLYHDVLRPEIAKLKSDALARQRASRRKALAKIGCSFAAITLGVVNGLLPTELAKLFTAVGGFSLLKEIGEAVADIQRKPNEVRNHDLYFLLETEHRGQA
jgi:hypothetical protein